MEAKHFFYEFGRALYHLDAVYDDFAKESEVAPTLLWILYALNDGRAHTQKEICTDWALPKSTVSTVMSELKSQEYVTFTPIKGKRREMTVLLTESGKSYANQILAKIYAREAGAFSQLTKNEKELANILTKLTKLLKEENKLV